MNGCAPKTRRDAEAIRRLCLLRRVFASLRVFRGPSLLLALAIALPIARAAPPTLDHLFPAGGQQGTTIAVTATGKFDSWPVEVWTDTPGLRFKPGKDKGKFQVEVATNAPPGPHLVRVYTGEGASTLRFFLVSQTLEQLDKEPNDDFAKPQSVEKLPVILNGKLDKSGDVDSYAVSLEAGQWLIAAVDAYRLRSTTDPLLRIVDTNGVQVAFNHDSRNFDPFLAWRAERAGTYVVQVMGFPFPATASVNLAGGAGYIYRLTLTDGPYLEYAFPPTAGRGEKTSLQIVGWNLAAGDGPMRQVMDTAMLPADSDSAELHAPGALNSLSVPVTSLPARAEQEPNNTRDQAETLSTPVGLNGVINAPGDEDRFSVEVKKGDKLDFTVQSASLGFPLDAWLRVEDAAGKELARSDDSGGSPDPKLAWTAPSAGKFQVVVGSVLHRGGSNHVYSLEIAPPTPGFTATIAVNALTLSPGKTNELKVTVTRLNGFEGKLTVEARDLPEGVIAPPVTAPAKSGDVTLQLIATTNAAPHNGPLRFVLLNEADKRERPVPHPLTDRAENNGVPGGYADLVISDTPELWLTIVPEKAPEPAKADAK